MRIQIGNQVIGALGILHFQYVAAVTQNALSVQDGGDSFVFQPIAFYEERRVNGLYSELAVQKRAFCKRGLRRNHPHEFRNFHAQGIDASVAIEWRFVRHELSFITAIIIPPLAVIICIVVSFPDKRFTE